MCYIGTALLLVSCFVVITHLVDFLHTTSIGDILMHPISHGISYRAVAEMLSWIFRLFEPLLI